MNIDLQRKLFDRFKFFHPEKSVQESLMKFGFDCGNGWFQLIWNLCEAVEKAVAGVAPPMEGANAFEVMQVKEKFAGLRFYTNWETEEVSKLIAAAEQLSMETCEECGKSGHPRGNGWIRTMCDGCYRE